MKIVSQSAEELILKEGNASGVILGAVFAAAGAFVGYRFHSSQPVVVWFGLAFIAMGLLMIFFSFSITVDANKVNGQLSYRKKRLIGGSNATYAIADILRIETRKQWQADNVSTNRGSAPRQVLVAQSVIVFKDGREMPLDHQKRFSSMFTGPGVIMGGQGAEVAIANQVAAFLGVPFQGIAPSGIGAGVNMGGPGGIQL